MLTLCSVSQLVNSSKLIYLLLSTSTLLNIYSTSLLGNLGSMDLISLLNSYKSNVLFFEVSNDMNNSMMSIFSRMMVLRILFIRYLILSSNILV